jgi:hypothetical protein
MINTEEGSIEDQPQIYPDESRPPSSQLRSQPTQSLETARTIALPRTFPNSITISIPSFSLPYIIYLWEALLTNIRIRVAPILLRRSIVFYCVLFLLLQLALLLFYQHQAHTIGNTNEFKRSTRVEPDLESFVNQRKDTTNTTTVLFADMKNKEWVHNFIHDLKKLSMPNYVIFAREKQVWRTTLQFVIN